MSINFYDLEATLHELQNVITKNNKNVSETKSLIQKMLNLVVHMKSKDTSISLNNPLVVSSNPTITQVPT